ncbi:ABC-type dipeptide/oligopeptide/nickel transport system ATPase component [Antricoccus suffuscus]|uniref:ABC-type dipeptide/oligopeptide/nickel transport system ATPase component n=1 Tax=Antricoccus suffuscus TaxID=1629062 RepID=A0A2T0ZY66_9ACTN|nr:dipeptide/oligopeptide/nickel ABC transporter permease/ATP-binding protein [Antricoccus suffuscus]PRZ41187.1 ABC-type dipeptide/oligopeptide/nickel transport system ATPase component [Antricoccus suffuscus]
MTNPVTVPDETPTQRARSFYWTFGLIAGLVLFGIILLIGIVAPLVMSHSANALSSHASAPPSAKHWFGTDEFGRDMLARSLVATRLTLIMTAAATAISVVIGVLLGTGIWLAPRRVRELGLRAVEVAVSYPGLLVALIITSIIGAGAVAVVIGIGIAGIPAWGRLTANLASDVSRRDFVVTARLLGVPGRKVITRHLLPNMAEPMLILVASGFAVSLIELSGLSFVGLGVQSPSYDYGKLLIDALPAIYTRPAQVFGPALMIVLTILSVMLIGDGLAAAADPRTAQRRRKHIQIPSAGRETEVRSDSSFVSVQDLRVSTDRGTELLHGVSFTIERGEIVGVVGESGSGKSVTAMALAKLLAEGLTASASEVRVGEMDMLGRVSRRKLATTVALVYQDPGTTFSPALRMGSQLSEVLRTHGNQSKKKARELVLGALTTVHMSSPERRLRQHPHELSGGMRQRAMIAAALAAKPELIIADEPTTALDVTVQAEILREFKRINKDRAVSMLFISHDIGVVEELCDRVLVMNAGEIVEELSWRQLAERDVRHPYTKKLIAATPSLSDPLPVRA